MKTIGSIYKIQNKRHLMARYRFRLKHREEILKYLINYTIRIQVHSPGKNKKKQILNN